MPQRRRRETNHLRAIYRCFPCFAGQRISLSTSVMKIFITTTPILKVVMYSEIGKGAVLIGISERTKPQGVENLAASLFKSVKLKK
ncbi:arginine deiminase family protein [Vibrio lentus]|nr:arginine deiminase family protein [Vibrio lentus]